MNKQNPFKAQLRHDNVGILWPLLKSGQTNSLRRSSSVDLELSSADLPAEFRGGSEGSEWDVNPAREGQSRLAKLCQQTSSVLTSVLPAPFGGHKRSILCQFFGQIPIGLGARRLTDKSNKGKLERDKIHSPSLVGSSFGSEAESVAILQHPQQPPIALLSNGHHPIEIVLDQRLMAKAQPIIRQPQQMIKSSIPVQPVTLDLKSSDSVLDSTYFQKVEPPPGFVGKVYETKTWKQAEPKGVKFSSPVSEDSFKPVQSKKLKDKQSSSSGWKIFNQTFDGSDSLTLVTSKQTTNSKGTEKALKLINREFSTTGYPISIKNSQGQASYPSTKELDLTTTSIGLFESSSKPNVQTTNSSLKLNPISTPASISTSTSKTTSTTTTTTTTITTTPVPANRSIAENSILVTEASKIVPAQKVSNKSEQFDSSDIRTIEVISQSNSQSNEQNPKRLQLYPISSTILRPPSSSSTTTTSKPSEVSSTQDAQSPHIQKREELVIASINNLTRIAFGNQLRDTVKVINRLIEQQSSLFQQNSTKDIFSNSSTDSRKSSRANIKTNKLDIGQQKSTTSARQNKSIGSISVSESSRSRHIKDTVKNSTKAANKKESRSTKVNNLVTRPAPSISSTKSPKTSNPRKSSQPLGPTKLQRVTSPSWHLTSSTPSQKVKSYSQYEDLEALSATSIGDIQRDRAPLMPIGTFSFENRASSTNPSNKLFPSMQMNHYPKFEYEMGVTEDPFKRLSSGRHRNEVVSEQSGHKRASQAPLWLSSIPKPASAYSSRSDSLTTLKLSLTTSQPLETSASVDLKPQTDGTTQSRWIAKVSPSPSELITTSSTTMSPRLNETTKLLPSSNDINEMRASETISRYTTHWNDLNEVLATTRRSSQQSVPPTTQQILSTGEHFNSETISNWPERYQTIMSSQEQADNAFKQTTQSMETTRRNGDPYLFTIEVGKQTDIASPRSDESSFSTKAFGYGLGPKNHADITILPPNHKLSTSAETYPTTSSLTQVSTVAPDIRNTASVGYTLVGPFTGSQYGETDTTASHSSTNTNEPQMGSFPILIGDIRDESHQKKSSPTRDQTTNSSYPLRPPYLETIEFEEEPDEKTTISDESDEETEELSRPHVARKLYNMLVPSYRNSVAHQNPTNQQRFNLSALKYLIQNLLVTPYGASSNGTNKFVDDDNITNSETIPEHQQLIDLLNEPQTGVNFYDSSPTTNRTDNRVIQQEVKSLPERAALLLRGLRKSEQKRAAAILAAIRYQVPSPLVRPWDIVSDLDRPLFTGNSGFWIDKRLDGYNLFNRKRNRSSLYDDMIVDNLRSTLLGRALKSALLKQTVIPRDELEARLINNRNNLQSERRSDEDRGLRGSSETFVIDASNQSKNPHRPSSVENTYQRTFTLRQHR